MNSLLKQSALSRVEDWNDRAQQAGYRVKHLAALCNCTPRQLERFFAAKFGAAPHAWMDELRFRNAEDRLAAGNLAKNVTCESGFTHAPYFSYWWKHHAPRRPGEVTKPTP